MGGGFAWSGGTRRAAPPVSGELLLDLAIFEDGLCVGPDRHGGFDELIEELSERRRIGTEILERLQKGASRGEIFELIRPLAQGPPPPPPAARMPSARPLPTRSGHYLAQTIIHQLTQLDDASLLRAFEKASLPLAIDLRRP
jgi:hypothetical protein